MCQTPNLEDLDKLQLILGLLYCTKFDMLKKLKAREEGLVNVHGISQRTHPNIMTISTRKIEA